MRVCVLGAGVVGLATAWALSEAGCEVTIADAATAPGQGASAGNGAQLSYNFVAPFASPDTLLHMPALLLDPSAPVRIKPRLDVGFLRWGMEFLRACSGRMARETTAAQLALAALSRAELDIVEKNAAIAFGRKRAGKLVLYREAASFAAARRQAEAQRGMGEEQIVLDAAESLREEPGLRIEASRLKGGVFTPSEELGDCAAFCDGLAGRLHERNSVTWMMGEKVTPVLRDGRLVAVRAGGVEIEADHFVLCLGTGSVDFAKACGFRLPIQPMKGYSLTLRPRGPGGELRHSVTDADRKIVFAPLEHPDGQVIRVAGIADLVGEDRTINPARLAAIRRGAAEALDVDQESDKLGWTGLRPATPDSRPLIGPSPIPGLLLNTGHGALGWTLACGSARLAVDLLLGRQPAMAAAAFAYGR
jgi:D-amino-acid dehydrogenase